MVEDLVITEIYGSIQGESSYAGLPCTFVRLTGCPLRCKWCDTVYGFHGGKRMSIDEIMGEVIKIGIHMVELTGGEPLAQKSCITLAKSLVNGGFKVLIETSGSEDVGNLPHQVHIIMDLKAPGSGMSEKNLWSNLDKLKSTDEVKIVCAHREDFDWALHKINEHHLDRNFNVLLSCAFGLLQPKELSQWILDAKLNVRLNLQQHKYIWHPRAKGV
jgi:7-carboxy-7-deazaguanine synthase